MGYQETVGRTHILKAGMDAAKYIVVDLRWTDNQPRGARPVVSHQRLQEVAGIDPNQKMKELVHACKAPLSALAEKDVFDTYNICTQEWEVLRSGPGVLLETSMESVGHKIQITSDESAQSKYLEPGTRCKLEKRSFNSKGVAVL